MRSAILTVALAGCASWPSLDPMDNGGALDPRLGTEIVQTVHMARLATVFQSNGLFVVYEEVGVGWHALLVDPASGDVEELPAPPLEPGETLELARTTGPARAALVVIRGAAIVPMVLDDEWSLITAPAYDPAGTYPTNVLSHDGRLYLAVGARLFVWDGAWSEPIAQTAALVLAGFDADTQWVLASDGSTISAIPLTAAGAGAPVTGAAVGTPLVSAINGDASGFQFPANGTMWTFDGASFTAHDGVTTGAYSAPGSHRVIVAANGMPSDTWTYYDDGVLGGTALAPFTQTLDPCSCNDSIDYVEMRPSPDAQQLAITSSGSSDGYAYIATRFLDLPYASDPWAPE